jgi:hypothetical protein
MAISLGSANSGGRAGRRSFGTHGRDQYIPLVVIADVTLIIFMLTAHVMEFGWNQRSGDEARSNP